MSENFLLYVLEAQEHIFNMNLRVRIVYLTSLKLITEGSQKSKRGKENHDSKDYPIFQELISKSMQLEFIWIGFDCSNAVSTSNNGLCLGKEMILHLEMNQRCALKHETCLIIWCCLSFADAFVRRFLFGI
jgi:hypothetical protein